MIATTFDYDKAFARNLGLVSEDEQSRFKRSCIALPGLGGVGGAHLQALARLGIGAFRLADPDSFDVVNFNRQLGATMTSVGRHKATVMTETALNINPDAEVRTFHDGITTENIDAFLSGVDVVVDGIEFFCIDTRRMLYKACRIRSIPVVTAGPIGYGAALLVFPGDGISFDEYFCINDAMTRAEQLLAFGLGLGPGLANDLDPSRIDFEGEKGPALGSACLLCAAVAATEVIKLLSGRGKVAAIPNGIYFDPYRGHTIQLHSQSSLNDAARLQIRDQCFERFPALRNMHEKEVQARRGHAQPSTPVNAEMPA